jgi:hypothetical protein
MGRSNSFLLSFTSLRLLHNRLFTFLISCTTVLSYLNYLSSFILFSLPSFSFLPIIVYEKGIYRCYRIPLSLYSTFPTVPLISLSSYFYIHALGIISLFYVFYPNKIKSTAAIFFLSLP